MDLDAGGRGDVRGGDDAWALLAGTLKKARAIKKEERQSGNQRAFSTESPHALSLPHLANHYYVYCPDQTIQVSPFLPLLRFDVAWLRVAAWWCWLLLLLCCPAPPSCSAFLSAPARLKTKLVVTSFFELQTVHAPDPVAAAKRARTTTWYALLLLYLSIYLSVSVHLC